MRNLINKLLGVEEKNSKDSAKDRLKMVLAKDRYTISPQFIKNLKRDIINILLKYFEFDISKFELELKHHDNIYTLKLNQPIKAVKRGNKTIGDVSIENVMKQIDADQNKILVEPEENFVLSFEKEEVKIEEIKKEEITTIEDKKIKKTSKKEKNNSKKGKKSKRGKRLKKKLK